MAKCQQSTEHATPKQVSATAKPQRLTLSHVRSVFRLLFEVRDLGSSPHAWRRHMVAGLLELVNGSTGIAAEAIIPRKAGSPRLLGTVIGGVSDPRLVAVYRALVERGGYSLDLRHEGIADPTNTTFTRTRQQMAENRAWRHRPDIDPWRTLDCDHFICSNRYLPSCGCVHLIILTRSGRERPFDELERRLVALFHEELGRLWRQPADASGAELPPHLQQTLELLLAGSSEKQIVARLDLSPHTVHDHVKRLYRRFHVNSRAQLLARLSHSPLIRAPRLCVNLLKGGDDHRFDSVDMAEAKPGSEAPAINPLHPGFRAAQA
jgi:DNA-binding CsgD family transcriptional regulator